MHHVYILTSLLVNSYIFYFELKLVFVMTETTKLCGNKDKLSIKQRQSNKQIEEKLLEIQSNTKKNLFFLYVSLYRCMRICVLIWILASLSVFISVAVLWTVCPCCTLLFTWTVWVASISSDSCIKEQNMNTLKKS